MVSYFKVCLVFGVVAGCFGQNTNDLNAAGQNSYNVDSASVNAAEPAADDQENAYILNDFITYNNTQYAIPQSNYAENVDLVNAYGQNINSQNVNGQSSYGQGYAQNAYRRTGYNRQNAYRQNPFGQNAYRSSSGQASAGARFTSPSYDTVLGNRVIRPCPNLNIDCIRDYFVSNSQCTRASGSIPNPVYQQVSNYYYPSVNLSLSQIGNVITGLNGRVNNFYVNPTTGITFLSVAYDENMRIVTKADRFLYHINGVEPVEAQVSSTEYFPAFQIATLFRGAPRINLANSYSVGFLDNVPILDIYNPTEEEVQNQQIRYMLSQLRSNFDIFVRESFVNRAQFFTAAFIQYTICDFGVKLNQPSNLPGAVGNA